MRGHAATAYRRINVTLPEDTVRLLERAAPKGIRSRLIAAAITQYIGATGRLQLRRRLREGARRRAERDLSLAREWFVLDEEAWRDGRK